MTRWFRVLLAGAVLYEGTSFPEARSILWRHIGATMETWITNQ